MSPVRSITGEIEKIREKYREVVEINSSSLKFFTKIIYVSKYQQKVSKSLKPI